jgi:hypothetical protein
MEARQPSKTEIIVSAVATLLTVGVAAYAQAAPDERRQVRFSTASWLMRVTGRRAWLLGREGIAEEAESGRESPRYFWAWMLGLLREFAAGELERLKI